MVVQAVGLGKLKPNVLFMGFKSNWQQAPPAEVNEYFAIIQLVTVFYFGI
jgi:hypothetical protein